MDSVFNVQAQANTIFVRPGSMLIELTPYMKGRTEAHKVRGQEITEAGRGSALLLASALGVHYLALPVDPKHSSKCTGWVGWCNTTLQMLDSRLRAWSKRARPQHLHTIFPRK